MDQKGLKWTDFPYFINFLKIASLDFFEILHEVKGQ